jgi:signal transduction histidine kinase
MNTQKKKVIFIVTLVTGMAPISVLAVGCGHGHKNITPERAKKMASWKIEDALDKVNASDRQIATFENAADAVIDDIFEMKKSHHGKHAQLADELARETPDEQISGLFRRIFLHSLLLMVLVFVGMGALFYLFGPQHTFLQVINQLSRTMTDQMDFKNKSRADLEAFFGELHESTDMSFALIGADATVYARAGDSRLSPLEHREVDALFTNREAGYVDRGILALPLKSGTDQPDAYLLVKYKRDNHHLWLLVSLAMVFLLVALVSIPLSRTIASPIEHLTRIATRFFRGELSARTDIQARNEIGVLARHMDDMARHLADRIRAEKELLANVSHELKSPLARLKVALALCREDDAITVRQLQQQLIGIVG